jgi:hypothetical protein
MKATMEIPDDLYRMVKAKSALEGRAIREVAIDLFRRYVSDKTAEEECPSTQETPLLVDGKPAPPWFGILRKSSRSGQSHDMEAVRESIAKGIC